MSFASGWLSDRIKPESMIGMTRIRNEVMKPIHERMPAIIAPAHYDLWLDPRITDKDEIMRYLNSAPSSSLKFYPISPWVNSPEHDDERCIQPV